MVRWGILCNDRVVQEVEKHFVEGLGVRSQHGTYREDYEEGGGESDKITDLQNFGVVENWKGSLVGGQPNNIDFG